MKRKSIRKFAEHGGQARVGAVLIYGLCRLVLALLMSLGTMVAFALQPFEQMAHDHMATAAMHIGYSPASQNTSNLPQSLVTFYDKNFVKNLKANTCFLRGCARRELPEHSGLTHQLFMYGTLGANVVQQAEGTVGSGISVTVVNTSATIGQYADYVNVSDISLQAAIDDALSNIQKELAYRLGLTISTLVRNTLDGAAAIDTSVDDLSQLSGVPFNKSLITAAVQSLAGRNVQPFSEGRFIGFIHPFAVGDAANDASNNSVTDILKRTAAGMEKLSELPAPDGDMVPMLDWSGVSFHQTTLVTQTANYLAGGLTALRTYIIGEDGVIAISLGTKQNGQLGNGDHRNLKLYMQRKDSPTDSDPSKVIGGWTSYNTKFVPTLPPDTTQRVRIIDCTSGIS